MISSMVGGRRFAAKRANPAKASAAMAVFSEMCSTAPRSRSEIVLRLTPSLRAKSAWDSFARWRPSATLSPTSKGFIRRVASAGSSGIVVT